MSWSKLPDDKPGFLLNRAYICKVSFSNRLLLLFTLLTLWGSGALGQSVVRVTDSIDQHIFSYNEIEYFEDPTDKLSFDQVQQPSIARLFKPSRTSTPQTKRINSSYWFRINLHYADTLEKDFLLEMFDQTIDNITAYIPVKGGYTKKVLGDDLPFNQRTIKHKNFEFLLSRLQPADGVVYFKIKSRQSADLIVVLRSVNWFIEYALYEYIMFGVFYGMILIFSLYNLLMFIAVNQKQYLYYVLYILSIAFYELSSDGIAYQYLWPGHVEWNQYAFGVALYSVSLFSLLFTKELLYLRAKAPRLNRFIDAVLIGGSVCFLLAFVFDKTLFNYKLIAFIPLSIAFCSGVYIRRQGYRPARFFVLGYGFLFLGFMIKLLIVLTDGKINIGALSYYSLSICFILEMILLSFAIGDRVRLLKKKRDTAQRRILLQMKENERLKDNINKELETQVMLRTREVREKSAIIEQQNEDLLEVNALLKEQADEIARVNALLAQDNIELQSDIEKVSRARVLSAEVSFDEFSKIYPDEEACYKFLSDLKWSKGYECIKCGNTHYFNGHQLYSRRCSKCNYEESVTTNTIFHNSRIPINKALYLLFLVYSSNGKISSHKLSELLNIRQSTCWAYSDKFKKVMESRKKDLKNAGEKGWSKLVLLK